MDKVTKLKRFVLKGEDAGLLMYKRHEEKRLMLGEKDSYEPLSRACFYKYVK